MIGKIFGTLGLILGGWILVGDWYVNQSLGCEDGKLISKFNLVTGCAFLLPSIHTLFLKSIRYSKIMLTVVFLVILGVLASTSGISGSITETKFNNLYIGIVKEIEDLYEINDENQRAEEIRRIRANLPTNIGIISIRQANYSEGFAKDFSYKAEDYVGKPYSLVVSNSIGQRPPFPGLLLGYIRYIGKKEYGCEKKILQYGKTLDKKKSRFLNLVLDYKTVKELMQNMKE